MKHTTRADGGHIEFEEFVGKHEMLYSDNPVRLENANFNQLREHFRDFLREQDIVIEPYYPDSYMFMVFNVEVSKSLSEAGMEP